MGEPNQDMEQCRGLNEMVEMRDVTSHAVTVLQLLHIHRNENMTMPMLIKEWRQNPNQAPEWYVIPRTPKYSFALSCSSPHMCFREMYLSPQRQEQPPW
jgi:hypothetical protein